MSTINLRNLRLGFANIAYKATDKDAEAVRAVPRYQRDADNKQTDILDGYSVDIISVKGAEQTVKLPITARSSVEHLQKLLADGKTVRIRFIGFCARAYSMAQESRNISGISCSADNVEVTSTEAAEDDLDLEIEL